MGAKVLQVAAIPRNFASADNLLDQLSGAGRLIFIASTATEPAWEIPALIVPPVANKLPVPYANLDNVYGFGQVGTLSVMLYCARSASVKSRSRRLHR
jgi:hypothetical protein